jgi:hypothetical protein
MCMDTCIRAQIEDSKKRRSVFLRNYLDVFAFLQVLISNDITRFNEPAHGGGRKTKNNQNNKYINLFSSLEQA